jgi:toxin ParE1/3/4
MRLAYSERFRDELRREYEFIRERNAPAAEEMRTRIVKSLKRLREFPRSGRSWRLEGTWELVVPGLPYIVIYEIEAERVVVLTLFHTSREFPPRIH